MFSLNILCLFDARDNIDVTAELHQCETGLKSEMRISKVNLTVFAVYILC